MTKCQFCLRYFCPRPQVKNPRACSSTQCQRKRQRLNARDWHERHRGIYDSCYHRVRKLQPKTPAERALMLALVLFFGLTTEDLANATCDYSATLVIHLRRRTRSYGRHYYNRDQSLVLPSKPAWLQDLCHRFVVDWRVTYQKIRQTYPASRLLLPRNSIYARPLHQKTILARFYQATLEATGRRIPVKVLRQTCGHLHSKNGDGSLLTSLGWSPSFSFDYTWLPRQIFVEPNGIDAKIN